MNPYHVFKFVPLSVLQILARFVAWIIILLPNLSIMRTIHINLQLVAPALTDKQKQNITKDVVRHQCLSSVESIKSWAM